MPKKIIHSFQVEYLQILNEAGQCDASLLPALSEKELRDCFEWMVLIRTFDEKALNLQRAGRLGTYAPVRGQEAVQVGCGMALVRSDWFFPAFREPGISMIRGVPMKTILQYWAGDERGSLIPDGINDFPVSVPVGTHLPHAVGAAWAAQYRKDPVAVLVSFGDGATSKGDFHESLNLAGVFRLPVVFVCQNNQWAISVPRDRQSAAATLAQKAVGYGFQGIQVDGNDLFAVFRSVSEALHLARSGGGPTLIECVTYRMGDHTTADDASRYRSAEEVTAWEKKDPIARFETYLKQRGLWGEGQPQRTWEEARERVAQAVVEFEQIPPPDPMDMFRYVYAQPTEVLREQMEQLDRERRETSKDR